MASRAPKRCTRVAGESPAAREATAKDRPAGPIRPIVSTSRSSRSLSEMVLPRAMSEFINDHSFIIKESGVTRIVGYIAASLDGFIATPDDGLDWLFAYDGMDLGEHDYGNFIKGIRTVSWAARPTISWRAR